jgi:hypothetical protein
VLFPRQGATVQDRLPGLEGWRDHRFFGGGLRVTGAAAHGAAAPVKYESITAYTSMLQAAGFESVQHYDTTELAKKDVAGSMYRLITKRDQIIASADTEVYYALLEIWAEF